MAIRSKNQQKKKKGAGKSEGPLGVHQFQMGKRFFFGDYSSLFLNFSKKIKTNLLVNTF